MERTSNRGKYEHTNSQTKYEHVHPACIKPFWALALVVGSAGRLLGLQCIVFGCVLLRGFPHDSKYAHRNFLQFARWLERWPKTLGTTPHCIVISAPQQHKIRLTQSSIGRLRMCSVETLRTRGETPMPYQCVSRSNSHSLCDRFFDCFPYSGFETF